MDCNAVSTVLAAILIIAVLATSISVAVTNLIPEIVKKEEIEIVERLRDGFDAIADNYLRNSTISFGFSNSWFSHVAANLGVYETGLINVSMNCSGRVIDERIRLFSLNLSVYSAMVPPQKLVFSESGMEVEQFGSYVILLPPATGFNLSGVLEVSLDALISNPVEVSGNRFYIKTSVSRQKILENGCYGWISVRDAIFGDYWISEMRSISNLSSNLTYFPNASLKLSGVDVAINIRDFVIDIN